MRFKMNKYVWKSLLSYMFIFKWGYVSLQLSQAVVFGFFSPHHPYQVWLIFLTRFVFLFQSLFTHARLLPVTRGRHWKADQGLGQLWFTNSDTGSQQQATEHCLIQPELSSVLLTPERINCTGPCIDNILEVRTCNIS